MSEAPVEPVWLTRIHVRLLHVEAIHLFGGEPGLRDPALLHNVLARAKQGYSFGDFPSFHDLAAAYGHGLARNQAFFYGNKRVALLAMRSFLFRNGHLFRPDEAEAVITMDELAKGKVTPGVLSKWLRHHSVSR